MYRSRLGNDLSKITLDYVSSIKDDAEIAPYDIMGSQAHVLMLYRQKIINRRDAKKILTALESLKDADFNASSGAEDIHELVESLVIKNAGHVSGGKMHTARSRNDQIALDMRMKIRDDINIICLCLVDTAEAMVLLAESHKRTVMPLYTHLQHAQAGLFSHYLLAHVDALLRDLQRLASAYGRVNESPLGAGAVGGTSISIDRHMTASLLGFDSVVENSIDATSTRDFVAEYVSAAAILMTNLSKMAEDFVIWSSTEFSFVDLADEFSSPSSVMPQKKNPDILELTRGKTAEVVGNLTAILATVKGLASGYGRDLQQVKSAVWSTSRISISALLVLKSVLLTLRVDSKRMKKAAESGYLVALDVAEILVQNGTPFRTAHKITGKLVQTAHDQGKQLCRLAIDDVSVAVRGTGVDSEFLLQTLQDTTVVSSLRKRKSLGSSGYAEQDRMIADRLERINKYRADITDGTDRISKSLDGLHHTVQKIIKS